MKYQNYKQFDISKKLDSMGVSPLDILVIGATGSGKSSTLNAIFNEDIAKVGSTVDPETMNLYSYSLNSTIRLWDSPGLGDSPKKDMQHSKKIINLLYKDYYQDNKQYGFIDLVLIILDGSSRDMGTAYKLINEVVVPNFQRSRILVAINQADQGLKGRYWNHSTNTPYPKLKEFLDDKAISIQTRVKQSTDTTIIKPIYYSAKYDFNIHTLLDLIIDNIPKNKRKLKH